MEEPAQPPQQRKPSLVDYLAYGAFRAAEAGLRLLPMDWVARFGGAGGRLFFLLSRKYRRLAAHNLRIAFGCEMSEAHRRDLLWQHAGRLGANLACSLRMPSLAKPDLDSRVEVEGYEHVAAATAAGRGIVFVIAHIGPWELLAQTRVFLPENAKPGAVYQALSNPLLDARVRRTRERIGHHLFERREGFFAAIAMLKEGGALGVLSDQHAGDAGVFVPFFGRLASTTTLPLLLAKRSRATLLALGIETTGPGRWKFTIEPVDTPAKGNIEDGLPAVNAALERMIRRSPADWFWVHNRWKTPSPAFLLPGHKRGFIVPRGGPPLQPFRLLVRSPNWLGDACMAVPAVRALKRGRPDLQLTILCPAKIADLWHAVPEVDAVLCRDSGESVTSVARKIKVAGPFAVGLVFPNSPRSAMEMRLGGVLRVAGYAKRWRRLFLDQIIPEKETKGPPRHHVEHYLQLAHRVGADCRDPSIFDPLPNPTPPGGGGPQRLGLCAGAEYGPAKRWPLDRFAAMAKQVRETRGDAIEWVLFGTPGEKAMGKELEDLLEGKCRNLVGETTLAGLIDALRQCRLLVSNDTGTMHLAALLGVPVVAVFGSTEPAWTRPLGRQHVILRDHVECSPCFLRDCPLDLRCMLAIPPARVAAEVENFLARD